MARTYYLSATNSDLSGGADFSALLATATGTPSSRSTTVGAGATDVNMAWTGVGEPGTSGATGNYSIEVNVTSGSTAIQIAVQVHRVNSSGTVQASSSTTAEQQATAGVKTFTLTAVDLGTWAAGDRLRVDYRCRSTAGHGNTTITIGTDSTDEEHSTPFTAAPVLKTDSDTGTETDTGTVTAQSWFATEAHTGADKYTQVAILYASPATGTLSDTGSVDAGVPNVAKSDTDTAALSELEEVVISDAGSEGTLNESTTLTAVTSDAESATLADLAANAVAATDTGTEADTEAITAIVTAPDTGTETEAALIDAVTSDAETGTLTEAATASQDGDFTGSESGTLADDGLLTAIAQFYGDTQSASETELIAATLGAPETGTTADTGSLSPAVAGLEVGTLAVAQSITATLGGQDSGSEADDGTVQQQSTTPTATDSAALAEAATLSEVNFGVAPPSALVAFGSIEAKLRRPRVLPQENVRDEDYARCLELYSLDITPIAPTRLPWESDLEDEDALILALVT